MQQVGCGGYFTTKHPAWWLQSWKRQLHFISRVHGLCVAASWVPSSCCDFPLLLQRGESTRTASRLGRDHEAAPAGRDGAAAGSISSKSPAAEVAEPPRRCGQHDTHFGRIAVERF